MPSIATLIAKNARWYQAMTERMRVCTNWNTRTANVIRKTPMKNGVRRGAKGTRPGESSGVGRSDMETR